MHYLSKKKYIKSNKNKIITALLKNKVFFIYNGVKYIKIKIKPSMIGYKLGSLIKTKKKYRKVKF